VLAATVVIAPTLARTAPQIAVRKYTRNEKFRDAYLAVGGGRLMQLDAGSGRVVSQVRKTPCRPRSWANFSPF
jgi:hypothetical protein